MDTPTAIARVEHLAEQYDARSQAEAPYCEDAPNAEALRLVLADAARYRCLRNANAGNPREGGIFIGCTPSNVILTEADADRVIDEFMRDGLQGLARNLQTVQPKDPK